MTSQSLNPGWQMVKFGDVVKNANLVERDPEGAEKGHLRQIQDQGPGPF
jgi:type I restriction enzyme, S subunit